MDARRSTSPSIMRVAQAVAALQVAVDEEARAVQAGAVPEPPALQCLRFPRFPLPGKPAPARNLLPVREAQPPLRRVRRRAAEAALVVVVVAVVLRPVAAAEVVGAPVMPAALVVAALRFRVWRSSTCCWRPVST